MLDQQAKHQKCSPQGQIKEKKNKQKQQILKLEKQNTENFRSFAQRYLRLLNCQTFYDLLSPGGHETTIRAACTLHILTERVVLHV